MQTIMVKFSNGLLKPLEALHLPEGVELTITINEKPQKTFSQALKETAGVWQGLVDTEKLKRDIYQSRLIDNRPVPEL
jgi:predicted DNA-binding antitoxin AbrB/MazE fold protein